MFTSIAPLTSRNFILRSFCGKFRHPPIKKNVFCIRNTQTKGFSSKSLKVAILGAASKTGNCLSLFLKQSPLIDELAIFDSKCIYGLALDLNYIDTRCKVSTCNYPEKSLEHTLEGAKIVMIIADGTTKGESDVHEVLKSNADTLSDLLPNVIKFSPQAMVAVVMNPINSLIPLAIEMYKNAGVYEYNRLFGVINLSCLRANTFAAEIIGVEPECMIVPVIGGGCSKTCIPLFSQAKPSNKLSQIEARRLTYAVRTSNEETSKANKDTGNMFLAASFAAARFCISLCKALRHQSNVVECAYVRSCTVPELTYFAAPLELGPNGIQRHLGIPPLNDYEYELFEAAVPCLKKAIKLGQAFALGDENVSTEVCLPRHTSYGQLNSPRKSS
ncbi:PREDICTED: probable malate dehydrogenase, mitochondrial [Eufriesea mexicana]|uniref:probable malate dehydrogenase, mitochondrial n=1 Tax=Eufriesea mexicana TaxID=516756 RepID=UPI00083C4797|nr:PREDICTED: probable malate dehydrogenase, mitochondrial [Eufriesea mexicana]